MCFLLFADVEEYVLRFAGIDIEKEGAEKYDIFLCPETKVLQISSKLGIEDKTYNSYEELLFAIITIGKKLYASTMIEKLDNAEYEITHKQFFLPLMTEGNEIEQLITQIRRVREDYANFNFRLVIKLGRLYDEYVQARLNESPTIKYTVDKAKERAKELCYTSDDPDVRYWCDSYEPSVYAIAYAVPEDKRIIVLFNVDDIEEVHKHIIGYNTAEEFFKALENFYQMTS